MSVVAGQLKHAVDKVCIANIFISKPSLLLRFHIISQHFVFMQEPFPYLDWRDFLSFDSHQYTLFVSLCKCMNVGILLRNVELGSQNHPVRCHDFFPQWRDFATLRPWNIRNCYWKNDVSTPVLKRQRQVNTQQNAAKQARPHIRSTHAHTHAHTDAHTHAHMHECTYARTHARPHPRSDPRRAGRLENLENLGLRLLEFS